MQTVSGGCMEGMKRVLGKCQKILRSGHKRTGQVKTMG